MSPRKSRSQPKPPPTGTRRPAPKSAQPPLEVVDPIWLLKALGVTALAAVFCAWLALCGLYYMGSWQLVMRPSRTVDRTPANLGIPFEEVRFGASQTGQPRLTAWWIPATSAPGPELLRTPARYGADTILYLHDGTGSLSSALPSLTLLHAAGINLFALDYRGFGHSDASAHPSSESMAADTSAALGYLTDTRHIPPDHIIPYGTGLGASLAVALARNHGELPAVILDNPDPDPTRTAVAAHPSGFVPIRLLYHEHFEIAESLATLPTPKLLISGGPNAHASGEQNQQRNQQLQQLFHQAASPALSVTLPPGYDQAAYTEALSRFLDQYLPAAPASR